MLRIRAFRGLRPTEKLAPLVASVPYDVVDREEAAALADDNPYSLLHVDRAEIDLPPELDPYSPDVYAKARENFEAFQRDGTLIRESEPCIYLYQQIMGRHSQTGLAAVCHIDDYENDIIKKHEKTRKDKEDDRTRLIGKLRADTGPVFLTYRENEEIDTMARAVQAESPLYDLTAPDGIRHTVWRVRNASDFVTRFAQIPVAYVADGHHRTASAVRVGKECRAANPQHNGTEDYNWFLAVLFPANQLQILPYNRCVHDLNGHSPAEFLEEVRKAFTVSESDEKHPTRPGHASMYVDGKWHSLSWQVATGASPIDRLDVTVLQEGLLSPVLGIDDPRTSKRIDFVGGVRGTDELERRVNSGRAAVAFSMYPVTVSQLMDIADANQIMPPKSTWFEPKLRSGLFIHTF